MPRTINNMVCDLDTNAYHCKFEITQNKTNGLYGINTLTGIIVYPQIFDKISWYIDTRNNTILYAVFEKSGMQASLPYKCLENKIDANQDERLQFCSQFRLKKLDNLNVEFSTCIEKTSLLYRLCSNALSTGTDNYKNGFIGAIITIPNDFQIYASTRKAIGQRGFYVNAQIENNGIITKEPFPINYFFIFGEHNNDFIYPEGSVWKLFLKMSKTSYGIDIYQGLKALASKPFRISFRCDTVRHPYMGRMQPCHLPNMEFVNKQDLKLAEEYSQVEGTDSFYFLQRYYYARKRMIQNDYISKDNHNIAYVYTPPAN